MIIKPQKNKKKISIDFVKFFLKIYFLLTSSILLLLLLLFFNTGYFLNYKNKFLERLYTSSVNNYIYLPKILFYKIKSLQYSVPKININLSFKNVINLENQRLDALDLVNDLKNNPNYTSPKFENVNTVISYDGNEYRAKMKAKSWETGQDDEELMEYAMHPQQYEDFKSGKAKESFLAALEQKKGGKQQTDQNSQEAVSQINASTSKLSREMDVSFEGNSYRVQISYPGSNSDNSDSNKEVQHSKPSSNGVSQGEPILAPLEGKFYATKDQGEKAIQVGDTIQEGQTIGYIEAMKVVNAVKADRNGKVTDILAVHGEEILDDDVILIVS